MLWELDAGPLSIAGRGRVLLRGVAVTVLFRVGSAPPLAMPPLAIEHAEAAVGGVTVEVEHDEAAVQRLVEQAATAVLPSISAAIERAVAEQISTQLGESVRALLLEIVREEAAVVRGIGEAHPPACAAADDADQCARAAAEGGRSGDDGGDVAGDAVRGEARDAGAREAGNACGGDGAEFAREAAHTGVRAATAVERREGNSIWEVRVRVEAEAVRGALAVVVDERTPARAVVDAAAEHFGLCAERLACYLVRSGAVLAAPCAVPLQSELVVRARGSVALLPPPNPPPG